MASVDTIGALESALSALINNGIVQVSMRDSLLEVASCFFDVATEKDLYKNAEKILNEHPILLPSGNTLRPDKVIVRNLDIVVLDFKTGKKEAKDHKQVKEYKRNLEEIFKKKVVSMLYYSKTKELILA